MRVYARRVCTSAVAAGASLLLFVGLPIVGQAAAPTTFKVAFFNIKSGKGQISLPGFPATFADTSNCTDRTQPLNAWGVGAVQAELTAKVGNDPSVVALGLAEAWPCATPAAVKSALGWAANSSERNGVALVARYGFAGPEQWTQLDTSLNTNPADTMWVLRMPVCLDALCSESVVVFTAHWYGSGPTNWATNTAFEIQAQQTIDFLNLVPGIGPQVLIGDLNVFAGTQVICGQNPRNAPLQMLADAGYLDAWTSLNGPADGFTGMWNRNGCGTPNGNVWKRIDYSWSRNMSPLSMARFGLVSPGNESPSDHSGIIVEYPLPKVLAASAAPTAAVSAPAEGQVVSGDVVVSTAALDDRAVTRVELIVDGKVVAVLPAPSFDYVWHTALIPNGPHTLRAAASDAEGNRTVSALRSVTVQNAVSVGDEIVLHASTSRVTGTAWRLDADATAAGGVRVQSPDLGQPTVTAAAASPSSYLEWTFTPVAGKAYRLWIRGRAQGDSAVNDAVYAQFTGSTDAAGAAIYRIGTTTATTINLEDCESCGLSGWGWQDNGWPRDVLGPVIYFTETGPQRLRLQVMEDGLGIDQVVLSSLQYMWQAPGTVKNDATILPATGAAPPPPPANIPPVVSMTAPASGTALTAPASVTLGASATDADNGIARVEFYSGATLLGSTTVSPYVLVWTNVPAGTYSVTARAFDTAGLSTTSAPLTLQVSAAANVAPTVSLTGPVANATFTAPASIAIAATVADSDGGVTRVDFYAGAILIGGATAAPYTATWTGVAAGSYPLTARATDTAGAVTTSVPVTVQVSAPVNVAPSVSLTSPVANATFTAPASIAIAATAADSDGGVTRVDFYAGATLVGSATAAPYTTTWTGVAAGSYTLTARATDTAGAVTTSAPVTVQVAAAANLPPTVTLTSPLANASFAAPASIAVAARATDPDGTIAKVEFYAGSKLIGTSTAAPYGITWAGVPFGTYVLTAKAYDSRGAVATSASVIIHVKKK